MSFTFTQPVFLWGVLLLGIVLGTYARSLLKLSKQRSRLIAGIRIAMFLLLVLGLSGLTLTYPTQRKTALFLLDESLSIDEAARTLAIDFVHQAIENLNATKTQTDTWVIPFASRPDIVTYAKDFLRSDMKRTTSELNRNETNIAAAIEQAAAVVPHDRVASIVLLSDGNETLGSAIETAKKLTIPVSVITLPGSVKQEVQVTAVRLPERVRQGEPFTTQVVLWSSCRTQATITLSRDGIVVGRETKTLTPGETIVRFPCRVSSHRQEVYTATLEPQIDTILANNTASNIVFIGGKPRVLFIDDDQHGIREYTSILRQGSMEVTTRPPSGIPSRLEELNNFDLVILSNVPASQLSAEQMKLLAHYVHDLGGGLLVAGGNRAFGPGGYVETKLDEILPVTSLIDRESEKPSLAVCLVLDRSGSMGGQKLSLATKAATSAAELLENDLLGVVAFDRKPTVVWDMQKQPYDQQRYQAAITSRLAQLTAGAGTSIYPALVEAFNQLDRVEAKRKHVILLTDGHSEPGDFDGILERMTAGNITLSTVGLGEADTQLLEHMARNGHGRFYSCKDVTETLPQIFVQETNLVGNSNIQEEPLTAKISTAVAPVRGIDFATAPPLLGFVTTKIKPASQSILETDSGKPLLAWRQYGLGMCGVFTSDVHSIWSADWLSWSSFPPLWQGMARRIMRRPDESGIKIAFRHNDSQLELALDAMDQQGRFLNDHTAVATLTDSEGSTVQTKLIQTAPGYYEGSLPWPIRQGVYYVQATLRKHSGEHGVLTSSRGLVVGCSPELLARKPNDLLMKTIAQETGGQINPKPSEILAPVASRYVNISVPLWPWLFMTALFLYFPELILRRTATREE
ncbi:MAG: VWA domain-containing protein [Planctomycetia bacterium]|nr:VWA domain-containing protein [Planctomycetia bacterium]